MGLITALLSSVLGHSFTFMTPAAFVRRPGRWIRELARKPDDTGGVFSAAPNFAFEHAAVRGLPRDDEPPLDLSNVKGILNGSEPVSPASMRKFYDAFRPYGLKETAVKPSYGLAEATLFVSTTPMDEPPTVIHVDRDELNNQRFVEVAADAPNAVAQVSAGNIGVDEWAVIVDPETASELPDGQIGEIWLHGKNLGIGYWGKEEETAETFRNILKSRDQRVARRGSPRRRAVGTHRRLRHLLQGPPLYSGPDQGPGHRRRPQPLPAGPRVLSAGSQQGVAHRLRGRVLRPGQPIAPRVFDDPHAGLKFDAEDTSEQLVIVAERAAGTHKLDYQPIADDIRAAIAVRHGVTVRDLLLVQAGTIPRTSSGKIGRRACRAAYLDGSLRSGVGSPTAFASATD